MTDAHAVGMGERYYQQIAVNRVVEAILTGKRRLLATMATGTEKTAVAFHICWKLWTSRWNRTGEHRHPRIQREENERAWRKGLSTARN